MSSRNRLGGAVAHRLLDPVERTSEVLFGLIMVLTFTGTISVAESGQGEIRGVLLGAVGCNLAWGIVDAAMYLMATLAQRARGLLTLTAVREARDPEAARRIIVEAIPEDLAKLLGRTEFEAIRLRVHGLTDIPARARFEREDFVAAAGVFLIVFLSTFPVVIPFLVMREVVPALRDVAHDRRVNALCRRLEPRTACGAAGVAGRSGDGDRRPPPRHRHHHPRRLIPQQWTRVPSSHAVRYRQEVVI